MYIPVYKAESELREQIQKNNSFAYCLEIQKGGVPDKVRKFKPGDYFAKASQNDIDLYYHQSILVSTVWNKNTDVFLPAEVWKARHSPEDKPTNIEHNEKTIVGHIVANWAIDEEGNLIDDNTPIDELPSKFHILTSSVIYRAWEDKDQSKLIAELIQAIEDGTKFVSMEALFNDFDYAIRKDDSYKIIARNEETAHLTKHLRFYGGSGMVDEYEIGRVPKNIIFSAHGYVDRPANPESIVFTKDNLFNFSAANLIEENNIFEKGGVSLNDEQDTNGDLLMSDMLKEQVDKLEAQNKSLAEQVETLKSQLAKADVEKYEATVAELKNSVSEAENTAKAKDQEISDLKTKLDEATAKQDELTKANTDLQAKVNKIEAERVFDSRVATLVKGGIEEAEAKTNVELFSNLNDDQFKVVADKLVAAAQKPPQSTSQTSVNQPNTTPVKVVKITSDDKTAENANLEGAEGDDDPSMTVASETDNDAILVELSKALASKLTYGKVKD